MKNRLICLALCLVFILSALLTSCGEKSTDDTIDEIRNESSANARTLTMWLVTEKKMEAATVEAVTKTLNAITETKFSTRLVLKFFTEDEYRQAVTDEIRRNEDARNPLVNGTTAGNSGAAVTEEESIEYITNEYGQFQKKYPNLVSNQVDIIYISGYDMYTEFIDSGWLFAMDSELSSSSKKIKEYISATLLGAAKLDGSTYAVPNNNAIGEYTYMLLDKKLMEECSMDGIYHQNKIDGFFNKYVFHYLETIRRQYGDQYVLIDSTYDECMQLLAHYWSIDPIDYTAQNTAFSLFGYRYTNPETLSKGKTVLEFNSLFADPVYRENFLKLNEYKLDGKYFGEAAEGQTAAVKFVTGDITDYEKYQENYYSVIVKYPSVNVDDVYENMIGVCTYSVDTARCMQIVTYLNTNAEFRNILQYGVEGEHFQFVTDEDGDKIVERLNDAYMVDIFKAGNAFLTYPDLAAGMSKDVWDVAKQQNRQALVEPLLNFNFKEIVDESAATSTSTPKLGSLGYTYTYTTGYSREILAQDPTLNRFLTESDAAGKGVYVFHSSKITGQNMTGTIYYYNNNISGDATVTVTDGDGAVSVNYQGTEGSGSTVTVVNFYAKKNSSNLKWTAAVNGAAVETKVTFRNAVVNFDFMETDTYRIELTPKLTRAMICENATVYSYVRTADIASGQSAVMTYKKTVGEGDNAQVIYTYFFFMPTLANPATVTLQPTGTASKLDMAVSFTTDTTATLGASDPKYAMFLVNVYADPTVEVNFNLTVNGSADGVTYGEFETDPEISFRGDLDLEMIRYFNRLSNELETLLNSCTDMETLTALVEDIGYLLTPLKQPYEDAAYSVLNNIKTDEINAIVSSMNTNRHFFYLLCATNKTGQTYKMMDENEKLVEVTTNSNTGESYHYFSSPYMLYFNWLKANGYAK